MSDDVADRVDVIVQGCSDSIFAPESLADIKCRLSFIEASECNCVEGPHENALHDLVCDDVPVLLKVVDQLAAELKNTRAQLAAVRELHFYVLDFCDEYVCGSCGQNPCPTLDVIDGAAEAVTDA